MERASLRVGICIAESKRNKLELPSSISELCKSKNIVLIDVNLDEPLEGQGPFDVILHKILEFRNEDAPKGDEYFKKFVSFINLHREIKVIDPVSTGAKLVDRFLTMASVKKCEFRSSEVGRAVFVPKFCYLDSSCNNKDSIKTMLTKNKICFPLIIKHFMAASLGKEAHEMSIIFGEKGLFDIKTPCFVQQFHNHSGYMLKIYTVGDKYYICKRPSIKNLTAGEFPTVYFNSSSISKRGKWSPLHNSICQNSPNVELINNDPSLMENDVVVELLKRLKHEFEFTLLGIDIIVDEETGDYGVIDVNYFPGYDGVRDQFRSDLVDLLSTMGRV